MSIYDTDPDSGLQRSYPVFSNPPQQPSGIPDGYALLEETPAGSCRDDIAYVTRGFAESRGWIAAAPVSSREWWEE
jgi:hypothetical protein